MTSAVLHRRLFPGNVAKIFFCLMVMQKSKFNFRAGQTRHNITYGLPPQRHLFKRGCVLAGAMRRNTKPKNRRTLIVTCNGQSITQ